MKCSWSPSLGRCVCGATESILDDLWALLNFNNPLNLAFDERGNLVLNAINGPTQGVGPGVIVNSAQFNAAALQYFEGSFLDTLFDLNMNNWSFSYWARVTNTASAGTETMIGFYNSPSTFRWNIGYITSTNSQLFIDSSPDAGYQINIPTPSSFHHFVATKDGNAIKYYVDGVQAGSIGFDTVGFIIQTNLIMRLFRGTTVYASGNIAQLAIWKGRTLTLADVQQVYGGGSGIILS